MAFHEIGHLAAAKRCGMETGGIVIGGLMIFRFGAGGFAASISAGFFPAASPNSAEARRHASRRARLDLEILHSTRMGRPFGR
jgi:hypothetical protein